jgi:multisubunit Na+/H+ antiporter MnhB subunit
MVDIRIPIGLMFTIVGVIITVFGFITNSDTEMYQKSLNINVNIIMGLIMLVFGGIMLYFAARKNKRRIE